MRVGRGEMPVDGIAAAGLHAAEVVPGVVRVDAGGGTEQLRSCLPAQGRASADGGLADDTGGQAAPEPEPGGACPDRVINIGALAGEAPQLLDVLVQLGGRLATDYRDRLQGVVQHRVADGAQQQRAEAAAPAGADH